MAFCRLCLFNLNHALHGRYSRCGVPFIFAVAARWSIPFLFLSSISLVESSTMYCFFFRHPKTKHDLALFFSSSISRCFIARNPNNKGLVHSWHVFVKEKEKFALKKRLYIRVARVRSQLQQRVAPVCLLTFTLVDRISKLIIRISNHSLLPDVAILRPLQ